VTPSPADRPPAPSGWVFGFNEYLLAGVGTLMLAGTLIAVAFYLLPPKHLQLAELQRAYRVGPVADFPVGASRVVNWGERIVLVIRTEEQAFAALQATAPTDGCLLNWDERSQRVSSPCGYLVYDLHGNVVRGLTTLPLQRYRVFVLDDVVYVTTT